MCGRVAYAKFLSAMKLPRSLFCAALGMAACASIPDAGHDTPELALTSNLGGRYNATRSEVAFRVRSDRATRMEVWIYKAAMGEPELLRQELTSDGSGLWSTTVQVVRVATL